MKRMHAFMLMLALALASGFTGCAGITTQSQKIEVACVSRNAAVDGILAGIAAHKVTAAQYDAIKPAVDSTGAVCQSPSPSLDAVKLAAFNAAIAQLTLAATTAGASK